MTPDERWMDLMRLLLRMRREGGWQVQRHYGSGSPTKQDLTIVFVRPEQPEVKA